MSTEFRFRSFCAKIVYMDSFLKPLWNVPNYTPETSGHVHVLFWRKKKKKKQQQFPCPPQKKKKNKQTHKHKKPNEPLKMKGSVVYQMHFFVGDVGNSSLFPKLLLMIYLLILLKLISSSFTSPNQLPE